MPLTLDHRKGAIPRRLLMLCLAATPAAGQCVQCFRNAQAQTAEQARAMNLGILFLLLPVFGLLCGMAWIAWRRNNE